MDNPTIYNDVFVSYSRVDEDYIKKLVSELEKDGFDVWYDREDIPKGANWRNEILAGVQSAHAFLFVISPDSIASVECRNEVEIAVEYKKRFIPVLYREISNAVYRDMHPSIGIHNWIFGRETDDWAITKEEIVRTIKTDLEHVRAHTRWNVRAQAWIRNQRDASFLITGAELSEAEQWLQEAKNKDPEVTATHIEYIGQSRQKVSTRNRRNFGLVSLALVLMTILSIVSFILFRISDERRIAIEENLQRIRSLALSTSSQQLETNQIESLALSMDATKIDDVPFQSQQILAKTAYAPGPIRRLFLHQAAISQVVLSPDGQQLASVDEDGLLVIADLNGTIQATYNTGSELFYTLAYSPDASQIWLAGCDDLTPVPELLCLQADIFVLDAQTGQEIFRLQGHIRDINRIAFNPEGTQVLTASADGSLRLWDASTGEQLSELRGHDPDIGVIWDVDYLHNSSKAISASEDATIILWDIETQSPIQQTDEHDGGILAAAVAHDDSFLVTGTDAGSLYIWDLNNFQNMTYFPEAHSDIITDIKITDDNQKLLSTSWDGTIKMWDITKGQLTLIHTFSGHDHKVRSLVLSPSQELAYSGSDDGSIIVWDLKRGDLIREFRGHNDWVWDLALSPDGQHLLSSSSDYTVTMWDWRNNRIEHVFEGHEGNVRQAIFHPNQTQILSVSEDGTLILWDIETGDIIQRYTGNSGLFLSAAFNSTGDQIIAAGFDGTLSLWDTASATQIRTFEGHSNIARSVAFLPDDKRVLSASFDSTLRLWDIETGETLRIYRGHDEGSRIISVTLHPTKSQALSAADDRTVILWDIETGKIIQRLEGHRDFAVDVAFNPDGTLAASTGWDGEVLLWDIENASLLNVYVGHKGNASSAVFVENGTELITVGIDPSLELPDTFGQFIVWRVDTLEALRTWTADNRWVRPLTCAEQLLFNVAQDVTCE